ncbi:hypothetical protein [Thalassotalea aquiviva]|uniref:hypothetical protein n=1 Tax=Thalassotalea aquiviva TaxID=3242415 RepID=UPI00352B3009
MTLFWILILVFLGVMVMVVVGEKYGKPLAVKEQQKYSKVIIVLVFVVLISALIKAML